MSADTPTMTLVQYRARIEAAAEWALSGRGRMTAIADEMTRLCGRQILRQQIELWLKGKERDRVEPKISNAIHLLDAVEAAKRRG